MLNDDDVFGVFADRVLAYTGGNRRVYAWLQSLWGESASVARGLGLVVVESFLDLPRLCLVLRGQGRGKTGLEVCLFPPGVVWQWDFDYWDKPEILPVVVSEREGHHKGRIVVSEWKPVDVGDVARVGFTDVVAVRRVLSRVAPGGDAHPVSDRLWGLRQAALLRGVDEFRVAEAWRTVARLQSGRGRLGFCHGNLRVGNMAVDGDGGVRLWGLLPGVARPEFDLAFWVVSSNMKVDRGVLDVVAGGGFDTGVFESFCGALRVLLPGGKPTCWLQKRTQEEKPNQTTKTGFDLRV